MELARFVLTQAPWTVHSRPTPYGDNHLEEMLYHSQGDMNICTDDSILLSAFFSHCCILTRQPCCELEDFSFIFCLPLCPFSLKFLSRKTTLALLLSLAVRVAAHEAATAVSGQISALLIIASGPVMLKQNVGVSINDCWGSISSLIWLRICP